MIFNNLLELFYIVYPKMLWLSQFIFLPMWVFQTISNWITIPWLETTFWYLIVAGLCLLGCSFIVQLFLVIRNRGTWQHLSRKSYGVLAGFVAVMSIPVLILLYDNDYVKGQSVFLVISVLRFQILILVLALLGMSSLLVHGLFFIKWLVRHLLPKVRMKVHPIIMRSIFFLVASYPIMAVAVVLIWIFASPIPNISGSRFFTINAAIKNTCFIDPKRDHCPHTLEEISYIEPEEYQRMLRGSQVQYRYYPEQNIYTLVVRYSPIQAVVFDPRLTASIGVDFKEFEVSLVGTDRVVNPPDFEGPWEFPNWWKY